VAMDERKNKTYYVEIVYRLSFSSNKDQFNERSNREKH